MNNKNITLDKVIALSERRVQQHINQKNKQGDVFYTNPQTFVNSLKNEMYETEIEIHKKRII